VATALWDYPHLTQVIHFGSYWFYSGTFRKMDISVLQLTLLVGKYHNVASSRFMLVLGKLGTGFQFVLHLAKFKKSLPVLEKYLYNLLARLCKQGYIVRLFIFSEHGSNFIFGQKLLVLRKLLSNKIVYVVVQVLG